MTIENIITPISKDGVISPTSILVKQSEFELSIKGVWQAIVGIFALIGLGTVLGWMI